MTPISSAGACACEYGVALSQWWAKAGSKRVARKQSPWASCCINIKRKNDVQELSGICTGLATSLAKSESPAKTHCCSPYLPLDSRRASQRSHHAGKLQCTRNFGRARASRGKISEGKGLAHLRRLRAAAHHARHPDSRASTFMGHGAAVLLRNGPSPR